MNTPRPPTTQTRFASPPIRDVLKAIQECGTDLVSIRDRKLVLQAAVHRTKILLGADMAYVSLNDLAAGETYIHTTDGVRTEAYRTIRQPLGTGVLGAAAAGTSMAYTADYLSDRNFVHVPRIDRIVEGEGVKTVAAAPLHVGGRVVGALLVAHRAHARLPDRARFVLTQLAVQTSIALGQVAHADEVAQLRTQIRERGVSDAVKLREFERMLQLDDRLMEGLVHATGPGRVLEILAEVLERPVSLYTPEVQLMQGGPLLHSPSPGEDELKYRRQVGGTAEASLSAGEPALIRLNNEPFTIMGVAAGKELLGILVMRGAGRKEWAVLGRAVSFVSTGMLVERTLMESDYRAQSTLIEDVLRLDGDPRPTGIIQRLADHGIGRRSTVGVICVLMPLADHQRVPRVLRAALRDTQAIISPHAGHICALVGDGDARVLALQVADALRASGAARVVGFATSDGPIPEALPRIHNVSLEVARAATALGLDSGAYDATALGVAGILLCGADTDVADALIDRFLGKLLDYDARHGTQLVETAWQYMENQGRIEPTADALHVHQNTVKQRLERITLVQGAIWRSGSRAIDTHFALRLWRVRHSARQDAGGTLGHNTWP